MTKLLISQLNSLSSHSQRGEGGANAITQLVGEAALSGAHQLGGVDFRGSERMEELPCERKGWA